MPNLIHIRSRLAQEHWPEVGQIVLAHWLAFTLDLFGQNLTQSAGTKLDLFGQNLTQSAGTTLDLFGQNLTQSAGTTLDLFGQNLTQSAGTKLDPAWFCTI